MPARRFRERDARISRAIAAGTPVRQLAEKHGLSVSTIYTIARREGWTWHCGAPQTVRFCALPGCHVRLPSPSAHYCSHACFVESRRLHLPLCANCGRRVKRVQAKYCSRRCYAEHSTRYWSTANALRNRRIHRDAQSGMPHTRIAALHAISPSTVSNVIAPRTRSAGRPAGRPCEAPGCNTLLSRRQRRFCSTGCFHDWRRARRPVCLAPDCGNRIPKPNSKYCSAACFNDRNRPRDLLVRLAFIAGLPRAAIALRTGLHPNYISRILRTIRRPSIAAPQSPTSNKDSLLLPESTTPSTPVI